MAGFGIRPRDLRGLLPVDQQEADLNQMVDLTGETTMARAPGREAFLPGLQAQYAAAQAQPRGISPFEILDRVLDIGVTDALDAARARRDAPGKLAAQEALLKSLGLDPREYAVARMNPKAWSEKAAERYGRTVAGEGSAVLDGDDVRYIPKVTMSGDSAIVSQGGRVGIAGQRPPSYQEKAVDAAKAAAQLLQEKRLALQAERYGVLAQQGNARIGLSRAAGARAAAKAGGKSAGGLPPLPPGFQRVAPR